ncbi:MAG: inositol monophosphatase family protein [Acidimicrobiales bacterium]
MSDASQATEFSDLTDLAERLAREAGALVVAMATEARLDPTTKSSVTDVVTAADRASEQLITAGILAARPEDGVLGEEGTSHTGSNGVEWHIDPIDGTTNYVYGIGAYSVSIAAAVDTNIVAGAVFDPSTEELFRATHGGGAWCNGSPISCRQHTDLATALVATGFGYRPELRAEQGKILACLLPSIRDIRRIGSAALDLCAVAAGRVDAYYEHDLNRWDLAAGALIAREAGATVGNLQGGEADERFLLAAAPGLFESLREALVDFGAHLPTD